MRKTKAVATLHRCADGLNLECSHIFSVCIYGKSVSKQNLDGNRTNVSVSDASRFSEKKTTLL